MPSLIKRAWTRRKDLDRLCQCERRADALRKQRLAARKTRAIFEESPATAGEDQL